MGETKHPGRCLCGAVRYEVSGSPSNLCFCHCESCRRAAGAPAVAWGTFASLYFRVTSGALTDYRSSATVTRGFCGRCGSTLTYRHDARPAEIDVAIATLDEPAAFAPQVHVWVGDKLSWESISDGLPQFAAGGT